MKHLDPRWDIKGSLNDRKTFLSPSIAWLDHQNPHFLLPPNFHLKNLSCTGNVFAHPPAAILQQARHPLSKLFTF
ncbi:hypothetical protein ACFLQY_02960 [Verrucomicrobiota bacterium]